jgi:hypothetical protein
MLHVKNKYFKDALIIVRLSLCLCTYIGVGIRDHATGLNDLLTMTVFLAHTPICMRKVILRCSTGYVSN